MNELAIVYSNETQECDRVACLLQSLEHPFVVYVLGRDFTQAQFNAEFGSEATYPQVAVGIHHIGSLKETLQHFQYTGEL